MTMPTYCAIDVETTGLDPRFHDIWEVGLYVRDRVSSDVEYHWFLKPDLTVADPMALDIGRYMERSPGTPNCIEPWYPPDSFAKEFAKLTWGAHLIGANPAFDAAFLTEFLHNNGQAVGWKFRLIDVESQALGYLPTSQTNGVPLGLAKTAKALGLKVDEAKAHTALADARLAFDCYDVMAGGK